MNSKDIQNACQVERAHDWRPEREEPEGFFYRATYLPDERLLLDCEGRAHA